jgi:Leucine-rich repeat (LRR) protein
MRLDLSHNELRKADFIEPLDNLETIDLSHNKIDMFNP